jgi:hypothetical protein
MVADMNRRDTSSGICQYVYLWFMEYGKEGSKQR